MLTVGLLHSVFHTLLLALSAPERSLHESEFVEKYTDNKFCFSVNNIFKSWRFVEPLLYDATRTEATAKLLCEANTTIYFNIAGTEPHQYSFKGSRLTSMQTCKRIREIDGIRNIHFWDTPAKDMLVCQNIGDNLTKIRKTFSVRSSRNTAHVCTLSLFTSSGDYACCRLRCYEEILVSSFPLLS